MTNTKQDKVLRVFESISREYDAANRRISLGMQDRWKKGLVRQILRETKTGDKVLDVCCGTGDIAIALAENDRFVTGIDFSQAMLRLAQEKGAGNPKLCWQQGDAMHLPFADGEFDAVCISFGLRNTADYGQVLREMRRVVRPGGWVGCIDSFVPQSYLIRPFYEFYFRVVMPLLGGGRRYRQEYVWLWRSTREFLTSKQLMQMFYQTGFEPVISKCYLFGACVMHLGRKDGCCADESVNKE